MTPATRPPRRRDELRLLAIDPGVRAGPERAASAGGSHAGARLPARSPAFVDLRLPDLPRLLRAGDLIVVNDAATLPASLTGVARSDPVEVRLVGPTDRGSWQAVLFGAGDWRTRTEDRPAPPALEVGARIELGEMTATVARVSPLSPRLVELELPLAGADLWAALYRLGRPVQYAHLGAALELWDVQTTYAARPWAVEMPSAGRPLSWELLLALRRAGVHVATLTHAAGLSATGDPALDAALPLPERFDIPSCTVALCERTRARGGRVVAIGTTVVRALEGSARLHGQLRAGAGTTDLVIGAGFRPRIVDGILSGMHGPDESHFQLLRAFAPDAVLLDAWRHASASGYRSHEFGDVTLILAGHLPGGRAAASEPAAG